MIIPVYRHKEGLAVCLEALRRQTYPRELLEILIVDNDPADPVDIAAPSGARVVAEPSPGSYQARNTGVRLSKGEVLAFTDADCVPDADWVQKGVTHLLHTPECGLVGGKIEIGFADPGKPSAPELYDLCNSLKQADYLRREHFAATANLFTFRSVFDAVGPFQSALRSSGDVEWGQRVFAAGYRQVFAAAAIVRNQARRSLPELVYRCRRIAGGRLHLALRNPRRLAHRFDLYRKGMLQALQNRRNFGTTKMVQVLGIACLLRVVEWAERGRCRLGASPLR